MLETIEVQCPYCGEAVELVVNPSVAEQTYIEDCEVCCRPMRVTVSAPEGEPPRAGVQREDE